MADNFGLKIGIEGEKEFKKALSDIDQSFKVLGSEMKLAVSQFDKNDRSVKSLTSRNEVLNRQIDEQKGKVETLRKALENASDSFGETDRRTKAWQTQLNNAQAELNGMERELKSSKNAIDETERASGDLGGKFDKLGSAAKAVGAAMAAAFAAVSAAAVSAGKSLIQMSVDGASYADNVLTTSAQTGIATDKLQEYMYAAELVDVSVDTLTGSMAKQIRAMKSAQDGSSSFTQAYSKLGVTVTNADGSLRDSDAVYWELIDALGNVKNETERDALAMTLLGKSAQDLNPLIKAGSERMNELGEEAKATGYILSDKVLAAYGEFDDQLQRLKTGSEAAKNALGTILLPVLTDLAGEGVDLLHEFSKGVADANGDMDKISEVLSSVLAKAMNKVMEYLPDVMNLTVSKPPRLEQKKKVAAYARVSSGKEAMLHSLSAQVSYYSNLIQSHNDWLYVGVYSDEATTGTTESRDDFQRLLADCRTGKVDMVLTKSISRFARNTVTFLQTVREFKALNVDIYFEEQNIHTLSSDGELMLSILASYAQEESRSASENQKWRIRKNFEEGRPWNGTILGYRYIEGIYCIVPEETEIVKSIFNDYLSGMGSSAIAKKLNAAGILTRKGNVWGHTAVDKVLKNDAYTGNLLLQKTYRENHITKRMVVNCGELPMYSAEATHEAIVSQEIFDAVKAEMTRRAGKSNKTGRSKSMYPFTGKMVCSICEKNYLRKITTTGPVWICGTFNTLGKTVCASKQIPEDALIKVTAEALGNATFDEGGFNDRIVDIQVCANNTLVYRFNDGTEAEKHWKDRSRSQSWTEEMKAEASRSALERRQNLCQKLL